jgi:hypothetical protein
VQHSDVTSLIITSKSEQSLAKGQLHPLCINQIPTSLITETNDTVSPVWHYLSPHITIMDCPIYISHQHLDYFPNNSTCHSSSSTMTSNTNKKYNRLQILVFTMYAMLMLLTTQKPRYIYYLSPKLTKIFGVCQIPAFGLFLFWSAIPTEHYWKLLDHKLLKWINCKSPKSWC